MIYAKKTARPRILIARPDHLGDVLLTLPAAAALYRRASLVIGIDSGPLHLAVMVGARVIGLYGPLDPLKWGPWCAPDRYRIVRVQIPCSPCDCIFDPPCGVPLAPPCTTGITVDAVLAAAVELLDGEFDVAKQKSNHHKVGSQIPNLELLG